MKAKRNPEAAKPCKLCGEMIKYIRVKKKAKNGSYEWGSIMPVNTTVESGDGKKTLIITHPVEWARRVIVKAGEDLRGVQSHFGTCQVYLHNQRVKRENERQQNRDALRHS